MFDWLTIFDEVNKKELETIKALSQGRFIKKWDFLFRQWDDAIAMYVIQEWEILLTKGNTYVWTMKSDSMFWEKAFLKWFDKRLMSAKASKDTILIVMLFESFKSFLEINPDYKDKMLEHFWKYNIDAKLEKIN